MSLRGPTRLADTQDASQPLRQALQDARREMPSAAQTRLLAERMHPWLDAPADLGRALGAGSTGAWSWFRAAASSTVAKIGLGAVLGATAATVALRQPDAASTWVPTSRLHTISETPSAPQPSTRGQALPALPVIPEAEHTQPIDTSPHSETPEQNPGERPRSEEGIRATPQRASARATAEDTRPQQQADRHARRPSTHRTRRQPSRRPQRKASSARAAADPAAELRLLRQAQDVLERDPERALQLARRHAKRFPQGMFIQEREVLAIEALLAQGRREPARQRTTRFLAEHPGSTHAPRLRPLLQTESGANSTGGSTGSMSH